MKLCDRGFPSDNVITPEYGRFYSLIDLIYRSSLWDHPKLK